MTTKTRDAIHAFIAAWNAHSPAAVQDVFAADGRLCDPTAPAGLARPAIGAAVRQALERIPDVAFALESVVETEDGRAAFEWRMHGNAVTPDGRRVPVRLEGCDVCQVRDGKIVELRGYFDRARIVEQMTAAG